MINKTNTLRSSASTLVTTYPYMRSGSHSREYFDGKSDGLRKVSSLRGDQNLMSSTEILINKQKKAKSVVGAIVEESQIKIGDVMKIDSKKAMKKKSTLLALKLIDENSERSRSMLKPILKNKKVKRVTFSESSRSLAKERKVAKFDDRNLEEVIIVPSLRKYNKLSTTDFYLLPANDKVKVSCKCGCVIF